MALTAIQSRDASPAPPSRQYLTFRLGDGEYGVPILAVREITGQSIITPIPNTPSYISGVMNLRGTVVPVVDLRVKLALPQAAFDRFTVIVLMSVGAKIVGMVVDAVCDVLDLPAEEIQPVPDLGMGVDVGVVSGLARAGERLIVLLDVAKVLDGDERVADISSQ